MGFHNTPIFWKTRRRDLSVETLSTPMKLLAALSSSIVSCQHNAHETLMKPHLRLALYLQEILGREVEARQEHLNQSF